MKATVKQFASRVGFNVSGRGIFRKRTQSIGDFGYEDSYPTASYAPWLTDDRFMAVYGDIARHTLVDKYRCFELWQLVGQADSLPGYVLEVGVWRGGTGCLIASNTRKQVVLCDTFTGVVKSSGVDTKYHGGEHANCSAEIVRKLASSLGVSVDIRQGIFPDDFPDLGKQIFAFVHIDVDVYQSGKAVFECVWPNMPVGGIVVFDDYGFAACHGITKFVNELYGPGKVVIYNLNGHAVIVKI